jgi:hypothetical protein
MENLEENQIDPNDTPIVIQFNKRDIPGVLPIEQLQELLGFEGYPYTEASAIKGEGVMETFKLVTKITAKHLFNRLKGKSEPIPKKGEPKARPAAKPIEAAPEPIAPEPEPIEPEPEVAPPMNPFADSVPFPESVAGEGYEKMEEVSLEQLLSEGRERPATMSGSVPIPIEVLEEVEELGTEELVAMEEPAAVAVMEAPEEPVVEPVAEPVAAGDDGRVAALQAEVQQLQQKIWDLEQQHRTALEALAQDLSGLTERVRGLLN